MKFTRWYQAVDACEQAGEPYVMATVIGATGSVPRDQGSKMIVTQEHTYDTLGGGHLEYLVTDQARQLLLKQENDSLVEHFPLGAKLGQCCGGRVTVLFECFVQHGMNVVLFGAGHVAKALVSILGQLPGRVTWVDSRADLFPDVQQLPSNVRIDVSDDPVRLVSQLPGNSQMLVLTHNHQLDFDLVEAALKRQTPLDFLGCIGSDTKAQRFQLRLQHKAFSAEKISTLHCPIGDTRIPGKLPMEVAVSITAQLLQHTDKNQQKDHLSQTEAAQNITTSTQNDARKRAVKQGVDWKQLKHELSRS